MSRSYKNITNPAFIRLLHARRQRLTLNRMAKKKYDMIQHVVGDDTRQGRLQRLKEAVDAMVTQIKTADNPESDTFDHAKAVIQMIIQISDRTIDHADWLTRYGYVSPLSSVQIDALSYLARECCHNLLGAIDGLSNAKQESYKYLATQTSELSKHVHAVVTGEPPLGEEYWQGSEESL